ncbi:hypothetical protein ABW20_dc0102201 [Dactylellina cionopaga]|nr:hypothetical protein ABW20_dc0102201 [Dactylellina cionopaga]
MISVSNKWKSCIYKRPNKINYRVLIVVGHLGASDASENINIKIESSDYALAQPSGKKRKIVQLRIPKKKTMGVAFSTEISEACDPYISPTCAERGPVSMEADRPTTNSAVESAQESERQFSNQPEQELKQEVTEQTPSRNEVKAAVNDTPSDAIMEDVEKIESESGIDESFGPPAGGNGSVSKRSTKRKK